jgi:AcrR family transcriptional regulator
MRQSRSLLAPREKIERTAYALFTRSGIRSVGVDTIAARSGVAKMTLYRHFASKDALALAYLDQRWHLFSRAWQAQIEARRLPPRAALIGVFDELEKWFGSADFTTCPVMRALLESPGRRDPVRAGTLRYLGGVRAFLRRLAVEAGVRDPDALAAQWHMLVWGAIIAATAGEPDAARQAKEAGRALLARGMTVHPRSRR